MQIDFIKKQIIFLAFCLFVLWQWFPVDGSLDFYLIQPWISTTGQFYLKHDFYLEVINHKYVKNILIAVYLGFFVMIGASFKYESLKKSRWNYSYFLILVIITTSTIGILKSQSDHACPWDMIIQEQHSYSWILNKTNGHCFPGGHASTGFALMAGYFIFRDQDKKRAYFYLCAGLILGFGMGWAQMMRGAHFLSHNLWTGWITWMINVIAYAIFQTRFQRPTNLDKIEKSLVHERVNSQINEGLSNKIQ